mmetsp:Transcript_4157/g.12117  ORF Transcript_4157/g.12117 Transcript_4157/m.12117 type:complete len:271 (+) Transcript_4157:837-1649(+)
MLCFNEVHCPFDSGLVVAVARPPQVLLLFPPPTSLVTVNKATAPKRLATTCTLLLLLDLLLCSAGAVSWALRYRECASIVVGDFGDALLLPIISWSILSQSFTGVASFEKVMLEDPFEWRAPMSMKPAVPLFFGGVTSKCEAILGVELKLPITSSCSVNALLPLLAWLASGVTFADSDRTLSIFARTDTLLGGVSLLGGFTWLWRMFTALLVTSMSSSWALLFLERTSFMARIPSIAASILLFSLSSLSPIAMAPDPPPPPFPKGEGVMV